MKLALLMLLVVLAGCSEDRSWDSAPLNYRCTPEQAKQVDFETRTCNSSGGYIGSYCYSTAIIRNCTSRIPQGAKEQNAQGERK